MKKSPSKLHRKLGKVTFSLLFMCSQIFLNSVPSKLVCESLRTVRKGQELERHRCQTTSRNKASSGRVTPFSWKDFKKIHSKPCYHKLSWNPHQPVLCNECISSQSEILCSFLLKSETEPTKLIAEACQFEKSQKTTRMNHFQFSQTCSRQRLSSSGGIMTSGKKIDFSFFKIFFGQGLDYEVRNVGPAQGRAIFKESYLHVFLQ